MPLKIIIHERTCLRRKRLECTCRPWVFDLDQRVLSCGDLLPGVRVCVRVTEKTVRQGYLRALTHGYGHHPTVFGLVELDPPKCKDQSIKVLTVTRHYRVEQISLLLA